MGSVGVLRCIDAYNLDLRELMKTVQTAYILAVRTRLATETLRVCAVLNRQLSLVQNDVAIEVGHRHLSRRNQIEIIHLTVVHLTLFIRQLARSVTRSGVHYRRRHNLRISGFIGFRKEEIDQSTL